MKDGCFSGVIAMDVRGGWRALHLQFFRKWFWRGTDGL